MVFKHDDGVLHANDLRGGFWEPECWFVELAEGGLGPFVSFVSYVRYLSWVERSERFAKRRAVWARLI